MANILFLGTGEISSDILNHLINNNINIVGVVSQPNKKNGRNQKIQLTSVAKVANEHNLPLYQPEKIDDIYDELKTQEIDIILTVAYGQIISEKILSLAKIIPINIHYSLLPKYRGASPVQTALINGDKITGVSIIEMVKKMDAGDILIQKEMKIEENDNASILFNKLNKLAKEMIIDTIKNIEVYKKNKKEQSKATFCHKFDKLDLKLNFNDSADNIVNKIRAFSEKPGCFFIYQNKRYKVLKATINKKIIQPNEINIENKNLLIGTNTTAINIEKIQQEGKKILEIKDFLNGKHDFKEKTIIEE